MREKDYALAVSYCTSAEDWPGLGRVVDRVLDEYITGGLSMRHPIVFSANDYVGPTSFARYASDIAPSLQDLLAQPDSRGIFVHRLMFAVRYAHFHQLRMKQELQDATVDLVAMFRDDVAPKSWWAVLLCDSVELLQFSMSFVPCSLSY